MTIKEAILILDPETSKEALLPYAYDSHQRRKVVDEACRVAVDELRKQQWISVKDRLPDQELQQVINENRACLDAEDNPQIEVIVMIAGALYPTVLFYNGVEFTDGQDNIYAVTHWQPMPEPPKEGVENAG